MNGKLLLGLIGASIQRSLAPALHEAEGRYHGLRIHYQLIDLEAGRGAEALPTLVDAIRVMRFAGVNVTHPCKQAVVPLLDALSDEARTIGAVNTVVREGERLVGHNTDASGWAWGFRRALPGADLSCVALLGAGGAGAACAHAVAGLGAEEIRILDRDAGRAGRLMQGLKKRLPSLKTKAEDRIEEALHGASGLIHATPTGMANHPGMALPAALLRPDMWVSEVVYVPLETPLLRAARAAGCRTMDGGEMNIGQAVDAFRLFTGREPDAARMAAHFRSLVEARP